MNATNKHNSKIKLELCGTYFHFMLSFLMGCENVKKKQKTKTKTKQKSQCVCVINLMNHFKSPVINELAFSIYEFDSMAPKPLTRTSKKFAFDTKTNKKNQSFDVANVWISKYLAKFKIRFSF